MVKQGRVPSVKVGNVYRCTDGLAVVVAYHHSTDVEVKFEDGTLIKSQAGHLIRGMFSNPYAKNTHSVGFIGQGDFFPMIDKKSYSTWSSMLARCYNDKVIQKHPTYAGCTVAYEWHNYQTFAAWYKSEFTSGREDWQLDKDLVFKGNRVYCKEFCVALPRELNCLLAGSKSTQSVCIGVSKQQKVTPRYVARCHTVESRGVYLGTYDTPDDAFTAYKTFKESYIQQQANKWRAQIDQRVYKSLMTYSVEITD